jgi:hypothetical protein
MVTVERIPRFGGVRHLATDTPSDVAQFDEFMEYLVSLGFAIEKQELR